ncbi:MAG: squalene/phytoene synthase family protein, partial [Pseudomonadota bacterium]
AAGTTNHAGPNDVAAGTNNAGTGTGEQTDNMPPIVQALTAPLQAGTIAPAHLCAMADGRQFDLSGDRMANEEDLQAYLSKTFGTPLAITARLCAAQAQTIGGSAGKADPAGNDALKGQIDSAAHWCGVAYGLATIAANPRRWAALGTDPFAPFADDPHLTVPAAFESAHTNAQRALADLVKSRAGAAVRPAFLPVTLARPLLSRAVSLGDAFLTRSIAISPMQRVLTLARHRLYWRL